MENVTIILITILSVLGMGIIGLVTYLLLTYFFQSVVSDDGVADHKEEVSSLQSDIISSKCGTYKKAQKKKEREKARKAMKSIATVNEVTKKASIAKSAVENKNQEKAAVESLLHESVSVKKPVTTSASTDEDNSRIVKEHNLNNATLLPESPDEKQNLVGEKGICSLSNHNQVASREHVKGPIETVTVECASKKDPSTSFKEFIVAARDGLLTAQERAELLQALDVLPRTGFKQLQETVCDRDVQLSKLHQQIEQLQENLSEEKMHTKNSRQACHQLRLQIKEKDRMLKTVAAVGDQEPSLREGRKSPEHNGGKDVQEGHSQPLIAKQVQKQQQMGVSTVVVSDVDIGKEAGCVVSETEKRHLLEDQVQDLSNRLMKSEKEREDVCRELELQQCEIQVMKMWRDPVLLLNFVHRH